MALAELLPWADSAISSPPWKVVDSVYGVRRRTFVMADLLFNASHWREQLLEAAIKAASHLIEFTDETDLIPFLPRQLTGRFLPTEISAMLKVRIFIVLF